MFIQEIRADIDALAGDAALHEEKNFAARAEAMDAFEFRVLDRIEGVLQKPDPPKELITLRSTAEAAARKLEEIDENLFRKLRADIRTGACRGKALADKIEEYAGPDSGRAGENMPGYDTLDQFINGLLLHRSLPPETLPLEPDMVYYQKTPVRVVFELIKTARLAGEDMFYDLGSGLGQVSILVNLLSGTAAKGIEFEPAYCEYAEACARDLDLTRVEFVNADARSADYSGATVFFMYTPFEGSMLQEVLQRLREEARTKRIRIFTYGPCTSQIARQDWLNRLDGNGDAIHTLCAFESR